MLRCLRKGLCSRHLFSTILSFPSFFVTRPPALLYKNHNIFLTNTNIPQHTYSYPRTATLKFCRNILSNRVNITFCSYSFPYILRNHKWKGLLHANEDFVQSRNLFLWLRSLFSKDTSSFSLITLSIS